MIRALKHVADSPAMSPSAHLRQALERRWSRFRGAFERCRKKCAAKPVHMLRVETRRLLAAVELLEPFVSDNAGDGLRRRLRKLQKRTASLRDVQVEIAYVEKIRRRFPQTKPFCNFLLRREERILARLAKRLPRRSLSEFKQAMKRFQKELEQSCTGVERKKTITHALMLRRAEMAWHHADTLRRRIKPSDSATIHCARVAFKRFRYMIELLSPLVPAAPPMRRQMQDYQSLMGNIQDTEVLRATLAKYLRKHPRKTFALAAFQRDLTRLRAAQVRTYVASAGRLTLFRPPSLRAPTHPRRDGSRNPQQAQ